MFVGILKLKANLLRTDLQLMRGCRSGLLWEACVSAVGFSRKDVVRILTLALVVSFAQQPCYAQQHQKPAQDQQNPTQVEQSPLHENQAQLQQLLGQPEVSSSLDFEVRVVWGGPTARAFNGKITVDDGRLSVVRNLSLQPDSIGRTQHQGENVILVKPHSAATFGGVDLRIVAQPQSLLRFEFFDPFENRDVVQQVTLNDLLQGMWIEALDEAGSQIAVQRRAHDRIRVRRETESAILDLGATWNLSISGYRTGYSAGEYTLGLQVVSASGQKQALETETIQIDDDGDFAEVPIEVRVPQAEGTYQLNVSLRQRRLFGPLLASTNGTVRSVEFAAFDRNKQMREIAEWKTTFRIEALSASRPGLLSWMSPMSNASAMVIPEGLNQFNPLAESLKEPTVSGDLGSRTVILGSQGTGRQVECLTLEPNAWIAIPLGKLDEAKPHRLRLRCPIDRPNRLTATIKSSGVGESLGNDFRIVVSRRDARKASQKPGALASETVMQTYDCLFWPHAADNFLVLANTGEYDPACVYDFEISEAELRDIELRDIESHSQPGTDVAKAKQYRRFGLFVDKPLLTSCLGAGLDPDPATGRLLESWRTWQVACERLSLFLDYSQANLLVMKVQADGGAIFPSRTLQPTPQYDSGIFFSDGRSDRIKDGVALILRHCERSGVRVILAVDLDAPLVNTDPSTDCQRRLGHDQVANAPLDPLSPRVQSGIRSVVREILGRYAKSKAFGGIQLRVDGSSHLSFKGDRWGHQQSIEQSFATETGHRLDEGMRAGISSSSPAWNALLRWRAAKMTEFYAALADEIRDASQDSKLYLNATRLWETQPQDEDFWNPQAIVRNPIEYMLACGVDVAGLRKETDLVFMGGRYYETKESVNAEDWIRDIAQFAGLTESYNHNRSGVSLIHQQPVATELPNAQELSEAISGVSSGRIFPIDIGSSFSTRQVLVDQIAHSDLQFAACGTWLPVGSHPFETRDIMSTMREFPPITLKDFQPKVRRPDGSTPLGTKNTKVRFGTWNGKTYVQIVNNSPWVEQFGLFVQSKAVLERDFRILGTPHQEPNELLRTITEGIAESPNGTQAWQLALAPYDVIGFEIADPDLKLLDVVHAPSNEILDGVAQELSGLEAILSEAADPTRQIPLAKIFGEFETFSANGQPYGWNVSTLPGVTIRKSEEFPHTGNSCLLLQNRNSSGTAWIQSLPFASPKTGRLAIQTWLRAPTAEKSPRVRLSVVGRMKNGERYQRYREFGATADRQRQIANVWGTRPASLFVADIPVAALDELFVSIELIGQGRVWIDDVQVLQNWLHPDERHYLQGRMLLAKKELNASNPFPAEQLLNSHWGRYLARYHPTLNQWLEAPIEEEARVESPKPIWTLRPNLFQQLRESVLDGWKR